MSRRGILKAAFRAGVRVLAVGSAFYSVLLAATAFASGKSPSLWESCALAFGGFFIVFLFGFFFVLPFLVLALWAYGAALERNPGWDAPRGHLAAGAALTLLMCGVGALASDLSLLAARSLGDVVYVLVGWAVAAAGSFWSLALYRRLAKAP